MESKEDSPDARRFLPTPWFAHWAGTERIVDGELSLAMPRPFEGERLVPKRDDEPKTSAFMRMAYSIGRRNLQWRVLELGSMHEMHGGVVLAPNFRFDEREQTAAQGSLALTLPLRRWWLVPVVGVGARADVTPLFLLGAELRSNRELRYGYTFGLETSGWTQDRGRIMAKARGLYRFSRWAALEEGLALGVWIGSDVGASVALQWFTAALQTPRERIAVYERVTLARGVAAPADGRPIDVGAWSADVACGFRYTIGQTYGIAAQADVGGQPSHYQRFGLELTFYGTLF